MKKIKHFLSLLIACSLSQVITAQLFMNSSGYVSVGSTSTANTAFQSFGNALFCTASGATNSAPYILANNAFSTATAPDYTWWYDSETGIFHPSNYTIGFTAGGYETMSVNGSGDGQVFMYNSNTSTSSYPLAVVSYVNSTSTITWQLIENSTNKNFYVYGSGQSWSYGWNALSDRRLKQNINTIPNALSKVLQLRGVTYNFIPRDTSAFYKKTRMGLIAQEVLKVAPEVVNMGQDSLYGIEYGNLVGLLVEAIKAQNSRIDSLATALSDCCNRNHERNQKPGQDTGSSPNNSPNNQQQGTPNQLQSPSNPQQGILYQNNPNPFSQTTTINCFIPEQSNSSSLMVFDMSGSLKRTIPITGKDNQSIVINGSELVAGMYLYTLIIDNKEIDTKKMILTQ